MTGPRFMVTCDKTGRSWSHGITSLRMAYRLAASKGLSNYTIEEI